MRTIAITTGSEDFSDANSGTDFHSTQVNSSYDNVAPYRHHRGLRHQQRLPVAFTIVAVDKLPGGTWMFTSR